jgi:hypothetical protein
LQFNTCRKEKFTEHNKIKTHKEYRGWKVDVLKDTVPDILPYINERQKKYNRKIPTNTLEDMENENVASSNFKHHVILNIFIFNM